MFITDLWKLTVQEHFYFFLVFSYLPQLQVEACLMFVLFYLHFFFISALELLLTIGYCSVSFVSV
jgi:hypothetical protein